MNDLTKYIISLITTFIGLIIPIAFITYILTSNCNPNDSVRIKKIATAICLILIMICLIVQTFIY